MSKFCGFCKKNGEIESFWQGHSLRDANKVVTCPVLKKYKCPKCSETGKHTASYCPKVIIKKKPPCFLDLEGYKSKLVDAQKMRPEERILYLLDLGFNPLRLEHIRQAAYIADYIIIKLGF